MAENPTTVMPDFKYQWDLAESYHHSTIKNVALNGRQQRMGVFPTAGYRYFSGSTQNLDQVQRKTLADFMNSVRGSLVPFYFYLPEPRNYGITYALGTVAASSTFDVPFKDFAPILDGAGTWTVFVAAVSKAFTVAAGAGANGQDRLTFTGGAQTGAVTGIFSGRALITGHFDMDEIMEKFAQNAAAIRTAIQIKIEEVQ